MTWGTFWALLAGGLISAGVASSSRCWLSVERIDERNAAPWQPSASSNATGPAQS